MGLINMKYGFLENMSVLKGVYNSTVIGMKEKILWELINESFYSSYVFYFGGRKIPKKLQSITKKTFLNNLINSVQIALEIDIKKLVSIEAHRQIKGQKVQIHNDYDYNSKGYPNIRLVWNLNGRSKLKKGGNFCFRSQTNRVIKRFPIIKNSAILFKISRSSYHSVDEIQSGVRDVIVFSFWSKRKKISKDEICFYP